MCYWEEMSIHKYSYNMLDRFNIETQFDVEFENIYTDKDTFTDDCFEEE